MTENVIGWQLEDGVAVLTMNDPAQSANVMNHSFAGSLRKVVDRLYAERNTLTGVIVTSAKKTFFAGGDLIGLRDARPADAARVFAFAQAVKADLRRLECLGRPVVAAINGSALGGGYEIALATHHRVALDVPGSEIGLPEVTLGLLPGGGGVARIVRLLGLETALEKVLLDGTRYTPRQALELGLVDELVGTPAQLLDRARRWISTNPDPEAIWDRPDYRMPGGTAKDLQMAPLLPFFQLAARKRTKGTQMIAPRNIVAAAVEGSQVDIDTALTIESRYFTELACSQVSTNLIQVRFFDIQQITRGGRRRKDGASHRALVLGAGMMGAGIAYAAAKAGIEVVLRDVSIEHALRGKAYAQKILDRGVARGTVAELEREQVLDRITPTGTLAEGAGADLVIEAVYESPELKKQVLGEADLVAAPDALIGSNTSTLPITDLAQAVSRPRDFIGLHFFSPVDKMPLVEIVVGEQTSEQAVGKALDIAAQMGKIPIVVNDSRGFFTSRVITHALNEAMAMVGEGVPPSAIEQASTQAGYPVGMLALCDELNFLLLRKVREETNGATREAGRSVVDHPAAEVLDRMIDEFERTGRAGGSGFYDYLGGRRDGLWSGLADALGSGKSEIPMQDVQERMLFSEALDSVRCLDEGVLRSVRDANVGSVLGIGFPVWTGGVIQYINQYAGALPKFVERADALAEQYGSRFVPPDSLRAMAAAGQHFH